MSDPAAEAAQRAWDYPFPGTAGEAIALAAAREALKPVRELHSPYWMNCINACCSGEDCKHRSRMCNGGCDEYWPCATAKLVYTTEELEKGVT